MALIKCPACGKEISEQAAFCVHCGIKLERAPKENSPTIFCPECGTQIPAESTVCPRCGFPIESRVANASKNAPKDVSNDAAQEVLSSDSATVQSTPKGRRKAPVIAVVIAVAIVAVLAIGYTINTARQNSAYNQYIDDLNTGMDLMLNGAAAAEGLCNTTMRVWHAAIFEHTEYGWDSDIRQYYASDFNDALENLYSDSSTINTVQSIKDNQDRVDEVYRRLQNPPEGLENAYAAFEEMHDSYVTLTRLAVNPTGSYQSYSDDFREADSACVEALEKLQSKIPEKK